MPHLLARGGFVQIHPPERTLNKDKSHNVIALRNPPISRARIHSVWAVCCLRYTVKKCIFNIFGIFVLTFVLDAKVKLCPPKNAKVKCIQMCVRDDKNIVNSGMI